jgi:hypothetical protein
MFPGKRHSEGRGGVGMAQQAHIEGESLAADYVHFWSAGERVKGEFHCAECAYGVTVFRTLPICPMCGGEAWEQTTWSPVFRAARIDPALRL